MTHCDLLRRLALSLAVAGTGIGPAQAATEPSDAAAAVVAAEPSEDTSAADPGDAAAQVPQDPGHRRNNVSPLDRRVNLLARELDLNAAQQAQVKKVLESQREQVSRIWNDEAIPAARRVSATQAIGDHTADQIRALLNDEQRKKYVQPRQRDVAVGAAGADAASWMKSGKGK